MGMSMQAVPVVLLLSSSQRTSKRHILFISNQVDAKHIDNRS